MDRFTGFSVVIPLFNKEQFVARALTSVVAQSVAPNEILVIDDGSTDNSRTIIDQFTDPRITLYSQANSGASAARNYGIRLARYNHIAFLDADDCWLPNFLSNILKLIELFPDSGWYSTNYYVTKSIARLPVYAKSHRGERDFSQITNFFEKAAAERTPILSSTCCVCKSLFKRAGQFPEGISLYEDLHLWSRLSLQSPLAYCSIPSSIYVRDPVQCARPIPKYGDLAVATLIEDSIEDNKIPKDMIPSARKFIAKYAYLHAFKSITGGQKSEGIKIIQSVKPQNFGQRTRGFLLLALAHLPYFLTRAILQSGRTIKQFWILGRG